MRDWCSGKEGWGGYKVRKEGGACCVNDVALGAVE